VSHPLGVLGKVSYVGASAGRQWVTIDTSCSKESAFEYLKAAVCTANNIITDRPYLVSEHVMLLKPTIRLIVDKYYDETIKADIDIAAWIEIEV